MTETCDWCGKQVVNDTFRVETGFTETGCEVGDCCGVRSIGLIKCEHAGPLLTQRDHSKCCGKQVNAPYAK